MNTEELTEEEEIDILWHLAVPAGSTGWRTSNCPVVRTTTKKVRGALRTAKKSIEWKGLKACELAIQAQAIFRRKERQGNNFVPQPVGLSVWLNEERWTMMLEEEHKEETKARICACGAETHGPKFPQCIDCMYG
jgi:hypothetical protein